MVLLLRREDAIGGEGSNVMQSAVSAAEVSATESVCQFLIAFHSAGDDDVVLEAVIWLWVVETAAGIWF